MRTKGNNALPLLWYGREENCVVCGCQLEGEWNTYCTKYKIRAFALLQHALHARKYHIIIVVGMNVHVDSYDNKYYRGKSVMFRPRERKNDTLLERGALEDYSY